MLPVICWAATIKVSNIVSRTHFEYLRRRIVPTLPGRIDSTFGWNLLVGQRLDLLDHERVRTSTLEHLAGGCDFLPGKRKQFVILSARRCGVGDRPVDGPIGGENHQRRSSLRTGDGAIVADRLLQALGKGASGVEHVTLHRLGFRFCRARPQRHRQKKEERYRYFRSRSTDSHRTPNPDCPANFWTPDFYSAQKTPASFS